MKKKSQHRSRRRKSRKETPPKSALIKGLSKRAKFVNERRKKEDIERLKFAKMRGNEGFILWLLSNRRRVATEASMKVKMPPKTDNFERSALAVYISITQQIIADVLTRYTFDEMVPFIPEFDDVNLLLDAMRIVDAELRNSTVFDVTQNLNQYLRASQQLQYFLQTRPKPIVKRFDVNGVKSYKIEQALFDGWGIIPTNGTSDFESIDDLCDVLQNRYLSDRAAPEIIVEIVDVRKVGAAFVVEYETGEVQGIDDAVEQFAMMPGLRSIIDDAPPVEFTDDEPDDFIEMRAR